MSDAALRPTAAKTSEQSHTAESEQGMQREFSHPSPPVFVNEKSLEAYVFFLKQDYKDRHHVCKELCLLDPSLLQGGVNAALKWCFVLVGVTALGYWDGSAKMWCQHKAVLV